MRFLMLCLCLLMMPAAWAEERIHFFHSDIQVHPNGSMTVIETIRVRAEGKKIRRGIYRDFPTTYKTASGRRHKVAFQVVGVRRDGKTEAWHTTRLSNGMRVYFGRSDVFLEPGDYEYQFSYTTNRQIGFFAGHDELYWNVTGNGWDFPISEAGARITLPQTVDAVYGEAYTGPQGAQGSAWRWQALEDGALFSTKAALAPREGLTVVLGWPKGIVREPTQADRLRWLWQDDAGLVTIWLGCLLVGVYFALAWLVVGRDPAAGVVLPEYEPPAGYSPAALRLIRRMAYDEKALSAAMVNLAVQGAVTIKEEDSEYSVVKQDRNINPSHDDEAKFLSSFGSMLKFRQTNHSKVRELLDAHKASLVGQYQRRYYYANRGWFIPGVLLSIAVLAATAWGLFQSYGPEVMIGLFMAAFFTAFAAPFLTQLWRMRQPHRRGTVDWLRLVGAGVPLIFLVGMFVGEDFMQLTSFMPWSVVTGGVVLVGINLLFNYLIKSPTRRGRALLDKIEGFRQYLSLAEGDELKLRYSKPLTPELFEAYLPYAIALDVETAWAERFANELREAGKSPTEYSSHWYDGSDFSGVRGIATSVSGSLAATVSSSSTAPGSSSGGGGGGSSGGGGGGGGGGGW